ncbi:dnase1 protein [Ilyonectria robusta]
MPQLSAGSLVVFAPSLTTVGANSVTFWTLDHNVRTLYFTPSLDSPVTVSSDANTTITFPSEYSGNFYAVKQGASQEVGMLGEVMFNGWKGLTYFDVSAIVNPGDRDNVKQMWPAKSRVPVSGCEVFPCDNAYYQPNDVQTKATKEVHLVTTLGSRSAHRKGV